MGDAESETPRTVVPIDAAPLLAQTFDRGQVTDLRHAVASCAETAGLSGQRLDDFVLVVNELITNAVRHGGGTGVLRLWQAHRDIICEVSDGGSGIVDSGLVGQDRPVPGTTGGWGLWLARQLSDELLVRTGSAGTTVRVRVSTAGSRPEPATVERCD